MTGFRKLWVDLGFGFRLPGLLLRPHRSRAYSLRPCLKPALPVAFDSLPVAPGTFCTLRSRLGLGLVALGAVPPESLSIGPAELVSLDKDALAGLIGKLGSIHMGF